MAVHLGAPWRLSLYQSEALSKRPARGAEMSYRSLSECVTAQGLVNDLLTRNRARN